MKFSGSLESQRLCLLLETAISREAQMWKVHMPKIQPNQDVAISPAQRDEVIQWLAKLKYQFHLYPETLALAVSLLDRFLATVKARPKYLNCIAISCFFLAAKTIEEDERIPVLKVLARDSFCGCSPAEIRRMEKIILDKLHWDLHMATPLDFLHIFHAVAVSTRPQLLTVLPKMNPSQHVAVLTKQLLHCMACYQLLQFKGSMLALAIISLELEKLIPDWLALIIELLQKAQGFWLLRSPSLGTPVQQSTRWWLLWKRPDHKKMHHTRAQLWWMDESRGFQITEATTPIHPREEHISSTHTTAQTLCFSASSRETRCV